MHNDELRIAIEAATSRVSKLPRGPYVKLNEPIDSTGNAILVASLGFSPPDSLMGWLSIHDGEYGTSGLFATGTYLLSAREIADAYLFSSQIQHRDVADPRISCEGPVRNLPGSSKWIQFAQTDSEQILIDMNPAQGGVCEQIVGLDQINFTNRVLFPNLSTMFASIAR